MNGASNEETVAHIRELVSSGINNVVGAKNNADKIEEMLRTTSLRDDFKDEIDGRVNDDNEDDDALSSCDPDSGNSGNSHGCNVISANDSVCSNNSLIGPVTDL